MHLTEILCTLIKILVFQMVGTVGKIVPPFRTTSGEGRGLHRHGEVELVQ